MGMVGFAFPLRYLSPTQISLCALGACLFNLFFLPRIHRRIFRESEKHPLLSGPFYYSLSVLVLSLALSGYPHIVAAAWAVMALGDGAAGLGGRLSPQLPVPWNSKKSVRGFLQFLTAGTIGSLTLLVWTLPSSAKLPFSLGQAIGICLGVSLCCAVVETLAWGLDDNLTVPLAAGVLFFLLLQTPLPDTLRSQSFKRAFVAGLLLNLILAGFAKLLGWIRWTGAAAGVAIGTLIFAFLGWKGLTILLTFLVAGSLSTKLGYAWKNRLGISESNRGARGAKEALANGGLSALLSVLASVSPNGNLFLVGFTSALGAATSDTVSSEIGQWLGGDPYLVTNFRRVRAGTNGAITLGGTLAGIMAAGLLGLIAVQIHLISPAQFWVVQLAALVGNFTDSFLGACVEGKRGIGNATVNFLNTLAGATAAMVLEWGLHAHL
jgi:uncharacterized protein (TIGR00297 family)